MLSTWTRYIQDLVHTKYIDKAAIFNIEKQEFLAISDHFPVTPDELNVVLQKFEYIDNKSLIVGGVTYCIRRTDRTRGIMAWNTDGTGCTVCRACNLLIVTYHKKLKKATKCNEATMELGDFFSTKVM